MPLTNCTICQQTFYVKPSRLERGWGKYCSKTCNYAGQRSGSAVVCSICGKQTYRNIAEQKRSKSGKYFCGKSCQTIWRNSELFTRENHANWKGGESSYRQFMTRTRGAKLCAKCRIDDPRILAVHHRDKNRKNNRPTNLVWLCHNCHFLVHHYTQEAHGFIAT